MAGRRVLTPVTITERYYSFRTGRLETWAAKSDDGLWFYRREESPLTPWWTEFVPTGECVLMPSLPKARAATASGAAMAQIEQMRLETITERTADRG